MEVFETRQGTSPLILGFPLTGTFVPGDIAQKLNARGAILASPGLPPDIPGSGSCSGAGVKVHKAS